MLLDRQVLEDFDRSRSGKPPLFHPRRAADLHADTDGVAADAKPRIAAQSGSTAKIITGDALPILTSITLSGVNGVSQQVQYVNVGVTLQIAPRVSPDGYVTSKIFGVVSSVTGFQQGYPTISQREAETSASVRDGETFVIGGLTIDNSLYNKSKVPILGDIPLIGQAFRVNKTSNNKTDLYVVITPHVVRHRRAGDP